MNLYKRPEKETDPKKYPGVVNYKDTAATAEPDFIGQRCYFCGENTASPCKAMVEVDNCDFMGNVGGG